MSNPPASKIYLRPHHEPGRKHAARTYIVYFITGNPGLIEYYRTFLTHLYGLLTRNTASNRDVEFQVYGRSLSGFEMKSHEINTMKWHKIPPYGLQDQIRHAEDELADLVEDVSDDGHRDVRVIVMGHSVGSYIALEIIRRLRAHGMAGEDYATRIIGGVALFPTVMEIVRSESGQKAAPFLKNSNFAFFAAVVANFLTLLIPISLLATLIKSLLGFPDDAAHTTASFIKSPHGVQQALHMARDEMFQIDTDFWDDDIWGAAHPTEHKHERAHLRFLFAKKDHWVADDTRDKLIQARGRNAASAVEEVGSLGEDWKPIMEIDEREGWPHGFCLRHGVPVAEKAATYVADIVSKDVGIFEKKKEDEQGWTW
jgi:pimeloyl-ACP methyl ester carboxylesterase